MELALNTGVNYPLEGPVKIHLSIEASLQLGKVKVVIPTGVTCDKGARIGICPIDHHTGMDTLHPHPGIPTILHLHLIIPGSRVLSAPPWSYRVREVSQRSDGSPQRFDATTATHNTGQRPPFCQPIIRIVLIRMSGN